MSDQSGKGFTPCLSVLINTFFEVKGRVKLAPHLGSDQGSEMGVWIKDEASASWSGGHHPRSTSWMLDHWSWPQPEHLNMQWIQNQLLPPLFSSLSLYRKGIDINSENFSVVFILPFLHPLSLPLTFLTATRSRWWFLVNSGNVELLISSFKIELKSKDLSNPNVSLICPFSKRCLSAAALK